MLLSKALKEGDQHLDKVIAIACPEHGEGLMVM